MSEPELHILWRSSSDLKEIFQVSLHNGEDVARREEKMSPTLLIMEEYVKKKQEYATKKKHLLFIYWNSIVRRINSTWKHDVYLWYKLYDNKLIGRRDHEIWYKPHDKILCKHVLYEKIMTL